MLIIDVGSFCSSLLCFVLNLCIEILYFDAIFGCKQCKEFFCCLCAGFVVFLGFLHFVL